MTRLELHAALQQIMAEALNKTVAQLGNDYVYYQPPASVKMKWPAIIYQRSDISTYHADNTSYAFDKAYMITIVDKNPDSSIIDKVCRLPRCRYDRHMVADNMNHDVFTIYCG